MYPLNRTPSKQKGKLSSEPVMLLEVTPSLLESLGIAEGSIVRNGSVSFTPGKGAHQRARTLQVVRLKKLAQRQSPVAASGAADVAGEQDDELLSAPAMAERMQCSRNNVYDQEKRGNLFSVVPPGRQNGRLFPAFQLEATLDRELLRSLIAAYSERGVPLNLLWDFLRPVREEFGGVTGVDVLIRKTGDRSRTSRRAEAIWNLAESERRELVMDVALEDLSHAFV